ncbi:hypothetical protein CCP4SC76_5590003 [Gammaproteobacteria bacterium]
MDDRRNVLVRRTIPLPAEGYDGNGLGASGALGNLNGQTRSLEAATDQAKEVGEKSESSHGCPHGVVAIIVARVAINR